MEKKTPLYDAHIKYNGKMVPFAGYLLPVQYETGVIKEHMAVRVSCGLFDVSHMGEIKCTGKDALENLNKLMTNDFTNMYIGQARYTMMCYSNGGIVDDLIVYKRKENEYLLVVNASNREKDFEWILSNCFNDVLFEDISDDVAQIAIQGPKAKDILCELVEESILPKRYYSANFEASIQGIDCIISKTGYTGESGYEIYLANQDAYSLWELLMKVGENYNITPCGLGARDTLRLEASMPLYGHEMSQDITPIEAGLSFAVKMNKDFIGKQAIIDKGEPSIKRVGLKVTGKGILREGVKLFIDDQEIGYVTSGTKAPYVNYPIAMAYINKTDSDIGTTLIGDVRGRRVEAEIIGLPFYKK